MKITFTNYGTNLLFVDDVPDPPIFKVFVMAPFDSMYLDAYDEGSPVGLRR